ncbi:MAG: hypothetical protein ISR65_07645 [Bacteriovoracaceae bacterium]|nr:hypothetical protein [Bacteriovoracaceae bacterium]
MKITLIYFLAIGFLLSSCSRSDIDYIKLNVVTSFSSADMLDQSSTPPKECKKRGVYRPFIVYRGKAATWKSFLDKHKPTYKNVQNALKAMTKSFTAIPSIECKKVLVDSKKYKINALTLMYETLMKYYDAHVLQNENDMTTFKWDELTKFFSLLDLWFQKAHKNMYPFQDQNAVITKQQVHDFEKHISGRMWRDIQLYSTIWRRTLGEFAAEDLKDNTGPEDNSALAKTHEKIAHKDELFNVFDAVIAVNIKVLESALNSDLAKPNTWWGDDSGSSYVSPILPSLIGDVLAPFFQRIQVIAKIYDISCRLEECDNLMYAGNRIYWLLNFFNSLALQKHGDIEYKFKGASEGANNKDTKKLDKHSQGSTKLFKLLFNNKDVIDNILSAMKTVFNVDNIATAVPGSDFPHLLKTFKHIFDQSHDLLTNYNNTKVVLDSGVTKAGYFTSTNILEVNVGFSKANMQKHIASVEKANTNLGNLLAELNSKKQTLVRQVLSVNDGRMNLELLEDKINVDLTELMVLKQKIDNLRNYLNKSRNSYYDKITAEIKRTQQHDGSDDEVTFVSKKLYEAHSFSAKDTPRRISSSSIHDISYPQINMASKFEKGDIIQISASGKWQPTCALSKTYGEDKVNAQTTSRGFTMVNSDGYTSVQSTNKFENSSSYNTSSSSLRTCMGYNQSSGYMILGNGATVTASIQKCNDRTHGSRNETGTTESNTDSTTARTDASFELGITLSDTPFTFLPAGSLLLVEMPRGESLKSKHKNIYVLNANNQIPVTNDFDYYLVANDCSSKKNSGELFINITRQRPQGQFVADFAAKIVEIKNTIDQRIKNLIKNGRISASTINELRERLMGLDSNFDKFQGKLKNLLRAMISNELAALSYKSDIVRMEREVEVKKQRLQDLHDQVKLNKQQMSLKVNIRNWFLSNIDLDFVNKADDNDNLYTLNRILNILDNNLVSYLDFKYRNEEKGNILGNVSSFREIEFSDPFEYVALVVHRYVKRLLVKIEDDLNNRPQVPRTTVAISIPNPYYQSTYDIPALLLKRDLQLDPTRSRVFWDKLYSYDKTKAERGLYLDIKVSDLYRDEGFGCFVESPIIESMGLFFIPENEGYIENFNNFYRDQHSLAYLEGMGTIPFKDGPRKYNFVGDHWRYMQIANRMAKNAADALNSLRSEFPPTMERESGMGTGRPLFGKFQIGVLRPYRKDSGSGQILIGNTPLDEIPEVVVAYVVSATNSNFDVNLDWISSCPR